MNKLTKQKQHKTEHNKIGTQENKKQKQNKEQDKTLTSP